MKKKISLLCTCLLSICLCACQETETVSETVLESQEIEQDVSQEKPAEQQKTEQSILEEDNLTEDKLIESDTNEEENETVYNRVLEDGETFLDGYQNLILEKDVKRAALIYLDEDDVPELLVLKNGEYHLYACDGIQIAEIGMPDAGIKAGAYGPKHVSEDYSGDSTFYWFEYVPYQGLIRVHGSGSDEEKCDYYLKYGGGSFVLELEAKFNDHIWHTYEAEQEVANEEFLSRLSDLGYDKLIPCGYLYENIADAYENIGRTSNTREVFEDFISGNIDALYYVEEVNDIPEENFVMRSYEELYNDFIMDDFMGSIEYVDFDNDGEEELIMRDYMGNSAFFDVIGDTVYNVIEASGTANRAHVAEIEGKRVIERTDLMHGGRKFYIIMQYDACGCLVDFFRLFASYEGSSYSAEDKFGYREQEITMEEFEKRVNSIQQIPSE